MIWAEKRATDDGTLLLRAEYDYDSFGNRIEKRVDIDGDSTIDSTEKFAYDGWRPGNGFMGNENWDIWSDLDENGSLTTRYVRGDKIDELIARIEANGDAYWLLTDRLGSVRDVLDDSGAVKDHISYDAFGNITAETNSAFRGRYTYASREFDVETEFLYKRARYYLPAIGAWTSEDPAGFSAGDSNLFRYVFNSPTNATDPSGLQEIGGARRNETFDPYSNAITAPSVYQSSRSNKGAGSAPTSSNSVQQQFMQAYRGGGSGSSSAQSGGPRLNCGPGNCLTGGAASSPPNALFGEASKKSQLLQALQTKNSKVAKKAKSGRFQLSGSQPATDHKMQQKFAKEQQKSAVIILIIVPPQQKNTVPGKSAQVDKNNKWVAASRKPILFEEYRREMEGAKQAEIFRKESKIVNEFRFGGKLGPPTAHEKEVLDRHQAFYLDGIQLILDGAGNVPVFGEPADGVNAVIYVLRGRFGDAGLSATAIVVPFIAMVRYAKRGARVADAAAGGLRVAPGGRIPSGATQATPGPVYLGAEDAFLHNARHATPLPGYYDVAVHGNANGVVLRSASRAEVVVDHRALARIIQGQSDYCGQPIRLISCDTGSLPNGLAQNLSNKMNVEVLAPNTYVWPAPSNGLPVAAADSSGRIVIFQPGAGSLTVSQPVNIPGLPVPLPQYPPTGQFNPFTPGGP